MAVRPAAGSAFRSLRASRRLVWRQVAASDRCWVRSSLTSLSGCRSRKFQASSGTSAHATANPFPDSLGTSLTSPPIWNCTT
jgi:hypothetical protein